MYDNDVILAEKQVSLPDNLYGKKTRQVIYYVRSTREIGRWGIQVVECQIPPCWHISQVYPIP